MPPRPSPLASARGVATLVLHRVASDAAFAARALDAELSSAKLPERDARLATEIVYGTLRMLPEIDARLDALLARGRPDPFTHAALRGATYQAIALDRVPAFAIVQETVAIVKQKRGERLAKLANAVLRRIVSAAAEPAKATDSEAASAPDWLRESVIAGLGEERAARYFELSRDAPPACLRVKGGTDREALMRAIAVQRPRAQLVASELSSDGILAKNLGDARTLPEYEAGVFAMQDEGAALVGRLVAAMPGERVLDACAGRGGKTLQLIEATAPDGRVTAVDLHARKLEQLAAELTRFGYADRKVDRATVDFAVGNGGLEPGFDRVVVDAPCTGLGTLRRRPEILLRVGPNDPARLASLQLAILSHAVTLLRPLGTLIFAVCSATVEEGIGVAERLEARLPGLRRLREGVPGVSLSCDEDGVFRIGPWLSSQGGCPDVYQVVRWERLDTAKTRV